MEHERSFVADGDGWRQYGVVRRDAIIEAGFSLDLWCK